MENHWWSDRMAGNLVGMLVSFCLYSTSSARAFLNAAFKNSFPCKLVSLS
jgi:hypothetical protein